MRSSFHLLDRYENDDVIVSEDIFLMKSMELTVKFMMELMESRTKSLWAELMMEVRLVGGEQFHQKTASGLVPHTNVIISQA